ncbi:MAG: hypothetical protein U9Q67_04755 [Patescibacteria group bacterium]|nr:hypothetical protein [Patescibacteria group bacterium]
MKNYLIRVILLEEIYGCCVQVDDAERMFGKAYVKDFISQCPEFIVTKGYLCRLDKTQIGNFQKRVKESQKKIALAKSLINHLGVLPWFVFAAVSGSSAYMNAQPEDDIDIFLVVELNRLWLTRFFAKVLFGLMGVRRILGNRNIKDKLCINYYVSTDNLDLRKRSGGDFLTALEIVMLKPILSEDYIKVVLAQNAWIKKYFPGLNLESDYFRAQRIPVVSIVMDFADWIAMKIQLAYMRVRKHPWRDCVLNRSEIKVYDKSGWDKRARKLDKAVKDFKAQ